MSLTISWKFKHIATVLHTPTSSCLPKRDEGVCPDKYLCTNTRSSFVCRSQKLKKPKCLSAGECIKKNWSIHKMEHWLGLMNGRFWGKAWGQIRKGGGARDIPSLCLSECPETALPPAWLSFHPARSSPLWPWLHGGAQTPVPLASLLCPPSWGCWWFLLLLISVLSCCLKKSESGFYLPG